ncbi:MAG TPA: hypothetical protein PKV58_01240 [Kaistella sp.]|nr:hypothetical protein [Kaistella sp.]
MVFLGARSFSLLLKFGPAFHFNLFCGGEAAAKKDFHYNRG